MNEEHGLRTRLWAHQLDAIRFAENLHGSMLDCDMGVGKTLMAIALAQQWKVNRMLVACPLSVIGSWERQVREHSSAPWQVLRLKGTSKRKAAQVEVALTRGHSPLMILVNHESLWRPPLGGLLLKHLWDLVVIDEIHRAKAPGGKFSFYLRSLRDRARHRLGLTGTPLPHSLLDAYAQYRFLDTSVFGPNYSRFRARYAEMDANFPGRVFRFQNEDDFNKRFRSIAFHVSKAEAVDLPPEVDEERECELEKPARKVYDDLDEAFWTAVGTGEVTASNALVRLLRLQQVTSGTIKLDDGTTTEVSKAKESLFRETLGDFREREPIVVFARFTADLAAVQRVAEEQGRRYAEVSGNRKDGLTPGAQMREDVDVLGVQIQAGGIGIDLSRASTSIFYSLGFNLAEYLQARARLHRPGQKNKVTHLHLIALDTVDEVVLFALRKREAVIEAILKRDPRMEK